MLDQPQPECPVVCRFRGLSPSDLGGYEKHRTRKGGDLGHVDRSRSDENRPLIGEDDWAARTLAMIDDMKAENFADELETLTKRRRKSQLRARMVEGPRDPWRATRHGPLREVILTANRDWFTGFDVEDDDTIDFKKRERAFEAKAVEWLRENFGDDVVHARADLDETSYHIHAIIVPKVQVDLNSTKRWMLQPSKHPLIKNYEDAQDSVGQHFASIGLVRGERRAAAVRAARQNGEVPPPYRVHVRTADWRKAEDTRIVETQLKLDRREVVIAQSEDNLAAARETIGERDASVVAREAEVEVRERAAKTREAEADAILALGQGLANGDFEVETEGNAPRLVDAPAAPSGRLAKLRARIASSPAGHARGLYIFSNAFRALRKRARAEAKAELAADAAEIRRADDTIVEIVRTLPPAEREKIGKIRRSLSAAIMALTRRGDGPEVISKPADPRSEKG